MTMNAASHHISSDTTKVDQPKMREVTSHRVSCLQPEEACPQCIDDDDRGGFGFDSIEIRIYP